MIGVFKDPRVTNSSIIFYSVLRRLQYVSQFCEYIEEDMLGSLKTPICVSASIFVPVE